MLWPGIEQISPSRIESVRHLIRAGARLEYRTRISVRRYPGMVDRCSLCNVAGAYFEFSAGHASVLELLLATGGQDLLSERGGPALRAAIVHGNLPAVERLLEAGVSPDHPGTDRRPPILLAVRFGQTEVLATLLQRGARVPSIEDGGRALLLEARHASDPRLAELLGPHDALYDYPRSPAGLRDAVAAGDLEAVKRLLDAGVDVNMELPGTGGTTIASLAASKGCAAILRALAARGADVDRACGWGSPLNSAVESGDIESVRALIEVGCDVNAASSSMNPLWHAAQTGQLDIVRLLLAAGADPYLEAGKRTPRVGRCGERRYAAMMDLLLSAMHDPVKRRSTLKRALRSALYAQSHHEVRYCLERAPDLYDEPDDDVGQRPLQCAAIRGDAAMLRYLLSLGPCTIEGDQKTSGLPIADMSPLASAVLNGQMDAVRVLVEAGASVSSRAPSGYTPLMYACYPGNPEHPAIVDFLLDHGADIDTRAADGQTALSLAVKSGLYRVVEALLRHGPDLLARDQQDRTVFDLAQTCGDRKLIDLLRQDRPMRSSRTNH
jgi:ankyrin repeat protein